MTDLRRRYSTTYRCIVLEFMIIPIKGFRGD
jgi:hypothetical protein